MGKTLKFVLWVVGIASAIAIVLRLTILDLWTIPQDLVLDSSLRPTLAAGDTVLLFTRGQRGFGDLVRCTDPEDAQRYVVGRIVGIGGDTVEVKNPIVTVNGTKYNHGDSCAQGVVMVPHPKSGSPTQASCQRIDMAGGWHYRAAVETPESPSTHQVGPGLVYLLSDNRSFHDDSRDFGAIPAESCQGVIFFRLWGKGGFEDESSRFTVIH